MNDDMPVTLSDLAAYLQGYLRIDAIPDYPNALNGVQLANSGKVTRIAAAVDAHLPTLEKAVQAGCDLLLAHHGLFWQGAQRWDGVNYRKLKLALDHDLAVYSVHIPLDEHPEVGNNVLLGRALGLTDGKPLLPWKGASLGLKFDTAMTRDDLAAKMKKELGGAVHVCPGGPADIRVIGLCTGGAGSEVYAAAQQGIDTFITGEGQHWTYTSAEELGINLIYGGHYATETFGVKALAAHLSQRYAIPWEFISHPTGL